MRDENSPLMQRTELRQERFSRANSFALRNQIPRERDRSKNNESNGDSQYFSSTNSKFFNTERNSGSKNFCLKFQQEISQKLMESKLESVIKCALIGGENQNPKNTDSNKKPILTNSYLMIEKMSPKIIIPLKSARTNQNNKMDGFGCKKLEFSVINETQFDEKATKTQIKNLSTNLNEKKRLKNWFLKKFSHEKRLKLARDVLLVLSKLKKCRLKKSELLNLEIFPKERHFLQNSELFFRSVVENNLQKVSFLLKTQPNLVFQYDSVVLKVLSNSSSRCY